MNHKTIETKVGLLIGLTLFAVSIGGMWAVFTFALRVFLPRGEWTGF